MKIGLLMVGHVDPKSQHIGGDYPELFADILAPLGVELVRYDLDEGAFPSDVKECEGWLCSPSRSPPMTMSLPRWPIICWPDALSSSEPNTSPKPEPPSIAHWIAISWPSG